MQNDADLELELVLGVFTPKQNAFQDLPKMLLNDRNGEAHGHNLQRMQADAVEMLCKRACFRLIIRTPYS